ncbi:hypothetical protein FK220_001545 [Flavobacteriaceae bacterium TP-CH-4]|uniref:Uncharacterized protein n=1 Tax=Pelagihabitans pacificus TaxID=2696054 RepID=A0A967E4Y5_9FLAO|nr:hypothetical protein [Pelagihabitans pacificus]NHF58005.1 hypothetical protein [Pelagihabitans pacificus]
MRKLPIYFFLLCNALLIAQSDKNVEPQLFKVNALLPGVSYELGLGKNMTFSSDALIAFAARGGSDRDTEFGLYPTLQADFRYFVNMERRKGKGKNISGNTGNYLAFVNQVQFGTPIIGDLEFSSSYYYNTGILYGIQRTRKKGFYWGVSFGPGFYIDEFDTDFGLFLDARLGWVIGKPRK